MFVKHNRGVKRRSQSAEKERLRAWLEQAKRLGFAWSSNIHTLYKFRSFQDASRKYVEQILLESKIYFSHPDQFNDPFDVAPVLKLGGEPTDPAFRKEIEVAEVAAHRDAGLTDAQIEELRRTEGVTLEELPTIAGADLRLKLRNAKRILCLTADRRHPLQWAHYANGHQGVCIHFRCTPGTWFGGARKVHYQKDRVPLFLPLERQSDDDIFQRLVLTKANFWRYENEYRMFADRSGASHIQLRNNFGYFAASDITGITIGASMRAPDRQILFSILRRRRQALDVWECLENEDKYSLNLRKL